MAVSGKLFGQRDPLELVTGIVVLVLLATMLIYAVTGSGRKTESGYELKASFSHIDGLGVGSDIKLAGITVGHVTEETVSPSNFKATVTFTVRPDIKLPKDSAAIITSDSLLGEKYIALTPGGDEHMLVPGATIVETQGSIGLQQLLSKFLFTVTDTLTTLTKQKQEHSSSGGSLSVPTAKPNDK